MRKEGVEVKEIIIIYVFSLPISVYYVYAVYQHGCYLEFKLPHPHSYSSFLSSSSPFQVLYSVHFLIHIKENIFFITVTKFELICIFHFKINVFRKYSSFVWIGSGRLRKIDGSFLKNSFNLEYNLNIPLLSNLHFWTKTSWKTFSSSCPWLTSACYLLKFLFVYKSFA